MTTAVNALHRAAQLRKNPGQLRSILRVLYV